MGKSHTARLRVTEAVKDDVYKDIARLHWKERGKNNRIGAIVAVRVDGGRRHYFSLRGLGDDRQGQILFDHVARTELKLELNSEHDFAIDEASVWERLLWAIRATDPAARIAAWIAVWSGIVGVLGLILGIIGVVPIIKDWVAKPEQTHIPPLSRQTPTK